MSRYLDEILYISYFNRDYNGDCLTDALEQFSCEMTSVTKCCLDSRGSRQISLLVVKSCN